MGLPLRSSSSQPNVASKNTKISFLRIIGLVLGGILVAVLWSQHRSLADSLEQMSMVARGGRCALEGSSVLTREIVLTKAAVQAQGTERLEELQNFTTEEYAGYLLSPPGSEHYRLLTYLVNTAGRGDCRHVVDIGTRYVASSLALASHYQIPVWTFDIPSSQEREHAFRGKIEAEWQSQVQQAGANITFYNVDLLQVSDDEFRRYMSSWLILLDTFHLPYSEPFEIDFMARLVKSNFKGIVLLDDIQLNDEMKKWWKQLEDDASRDGYVSHDVSFVGHSSGTGLLDFSGKVKWRLPPVVREAHGILVDVMVALRRT